jgi:hypothetical protein
MAGERVTRRLVKSFDGAPCCVDDSLQAYREWGGPVYHTHDKGHTWCKHCWPPRGRGRGEARASVRRVQAIFLRREARALRRQQLLDADAEGKWWPGGTSYAEIGRMLGRSKSWAYYACNPHLRRPLAWQ